MVKFPSSLAVMLFVGLIGFLGSVINVSAHELNIHDYDPIPLQKGDWVSKIALAKTGHIANWKKCPVQNPRTKKWYRLNEYNRLPIGAIVYVPIALEQSSLGAIDGKRFNAYLDARSTHKEPRIIENIIASAWHSVPTAQQTMGTEHSDYDADALYAQLLNMLHSTGSLIGIVIAFTILLITLQRRWRERVKLVLLGRDMIDHLCNRNITLNRSELYSALRAGFFTKRIILSGVLSTQDMDILHDIIIQPRFAVFGIALKAMRLHDDYMEIALEAKHIREFTFNNKSKEDEIAFCAMASEFADNVFEAFCKPRRNSLDPEPMTKEICINATLGSLEIKIMPTAGHTFPSFTQEPESTNTFQRFEKVRGEIARVFGDQVVVHKPRALKHGISLSFSFSRIPSSEIITSSTKEIN